MGTTTPSPGVGRREFLKRASITAGSAAAFSLVPFSFVRAETIRSAGSLRRFLESKRREMRSPALSAAVISRHGLEWTDGVGWANREAGIRANADTVFMLASVSKTITCAGVMAAVEHEKLDLDADVNDILPYDVVIPGYPGVITIRQLLTHTSAIRDRYSVWGLPGEPDTLYSHGDSPIPLGEFLQSYLEVGGSRYVEDKNFYDTPPGSKYHYCNIGVSLAAYLAELVTGTMFSEVVRQRIIDPLGMQQSGFHLADITTPNLAMPYKFRRGTGNVPVYQYGYPDYPDGAFRASAPELSKWLSAFMNFGELDGVRILQQDTVEEIRRDQHVAYWHQGLIWWAGVGPVEHMGHTGSDTGVRTRMFFNPQTEVGVISLCNTTLHAQQDKSFRDVEQHLFDVFS